MKFVFSSQIAKLHHGNFMIAPSIHFSHAHHWHQSCSLKAFHFWASLPHLCIPVWTSCTIWKPRRATLSHLCTLAANIPNASDRVFPDWTRNFRLAHCTAPIGWWPKIEELLIKVCEKTYNHCREPKSQLYTSRSLRHTVTQLLNPYSTRSLHSTLHPVTFLTQLITVRKSFHFDLGSF